MSSVTIAQISDTHMRYAPSDAADDFSPDATLRRTVDAVASYAPDLVLLTGDISDDGSLEGCERARDIIARLGVPILATPGNHDVATIVAQVFGDATATTILGWHVVAIDTAVPAKEAGRLDVPSALAAIDALDGPTLVALHHPPISLSTHPWFQLDGGGALVSALAERPNVRAVVSGHLHQAFDVHLGHVSYIGCPSSWYGIAHHGSTWVEDRGGLVGAHVFHLAHNGTLTFTAVRRPN